jgi:uncharacterized protein (TIGR02466 family)
VSNIHNIFPTPVLKDKISRPISVEEKKIFDNFEKKTSVGNSTTVNKYILNSPELQSLKSLIEEKIKEYFYTVYNPEEDIEIFITQSWLSLTMPGEHHHKHSHPNSFVSGVLYINSDAYKDKILFFNKHQKELTITPKEFNLWNSDSWYFSVESGDILIFPSNLEHMVETVEELDNRNVRVSLAFNTFIKGKLGTYGTSTELIL